MKYIYAKRTSSCSRERRGPINIQDLLIGVFPAYLYARGLPFELGYGKLHTQTVSIG